VSTDGDTFWIDMGAGSPDGDPIASRLYMLRPPRDWQHEPTAAGYRLDHVSSIVPDRYGNVFVRTDVNGEPVLVVRRRGYRWSADIGAGRPPNDAIRGIAREARGDQVWLLGNPDGGDHLYLQTPETTWTDTGLLPNDIKSLEHMAGDAVGHLWWSNEDGLGVRWRGETSAGAPWWSAPTWRHLPPEGLLADSETLWLRTSDAHTVLIGLHTEVLGDLVVEIDCPVYEADQLTR